MTDEQKMLPLSPDAPIDLEQVKIDVRMLILRPEPRPNAKLRQSVAAWGVLQPILVHYVDGKNVVVDGNRRGLAAIEAEEAARKANPGVPYVANVPIVRSADLHYLKHVATIMLNETRDPNPMAEYESVDALVKLGYDEKTIASKTGMAVGTVRKRMQLANLIPEIRLMVDQGEIKASVAEKIAKLSPSEQDHLMDKAIERGVSEANPGVDASPRVTLDDVRAVRTASAQAQMADLPTFDEPDVRLSLDAVKGEVQKRAHALIDFALSNQMKLTTVLAVVRAAAGEYSGDTRGNQQSND